jgi:hypothetical protein
LLKSIRVFQNSKQQARLSLVLVTITWRSKSLKLVIQHFLACHRLVSLSQSVWCHHCCVRLLHCRVCIHILVYFCIKLILVSRTKALNKLRQRRNRGDSPIKNSLEKILAILGTGRAAHHGGNLNGNNFKQMFQESDCIFL